MKLERILTSRCRKNNYNLGQFCYFLYFVSIFQFLPKSSNFTDFINSFHSFLRFSVNFAYLKIFIRQFNFDNFVSIRPILMFLCHFCQLWQCWVIFANFNNVESFLPILKILCHFDQFWQFCVGFVNFYDLFHFCKFWYFCLNLPIVATLC